MINKTPATKKIASPKNINFLEKIIFIIKLKYSSILIVNIQWYNKIKQKADQLGVELLITPGNHDQGDYDASQFKDNPPFFIGKDLSGEGIALIGLDYRKSSSYFMELDQFSKVFVFSHNVFVDSTYYKDHDMSKLSANFINELKSLNGQCALIAGDQHIYDNQTHSSGCLAVVDGVAGGDHASTRKDSKGIYQNYASYALFEVYPKGFKVCPIKETNNFKINEADCTYRNK